MSKASPARTDLTDDTLAKRSQANIFTGVSGLYWSHVYRKPPHPTQLVFSTVGWTGAYFLWQAIRYLLPLADHQVPTPDGKHRCQFTMFVNIETK